jgi:hypothetical protein
MAKPQEGQASRASGTYVVTVAEDGAEDWRAAPSHALSADEDRAMDALFHGKKRTRRGKRVIEYLTGEEENAALELLSRLLVYRRLPPWYLLEIAFQVNPKARPAVQPRRIVFVSRQRRGAKGHTAISRHMAMDVVKAAFEGEKLDLAFKTTAATYGVSERTVIRAWNDFRKNPAVREYIRQEKEKFRSSAK